MVYETLNNFVITMEHTVTTNSVGKVLQGEHLFRIEQKEKNWEKALVKEKYI